MNLRTNQRIKEEDQFEGLSNFKLSLDLPLVRVASIEAYPQTARQLVPLTEREGPAAPQSLTQSPMEVPRLDIHLESTGILLLVDTAIVGECSLAEDNIPGHRKHTEQVLLGGK